MTLPPPLDLILPDPGATDRLGAALAQVLKSGDTVLLDGPIGAGKTHLARAMIQSLLAADGRAEDVPSPTFTLMQSYDTRAGEVVHADLYRLRGPGGLDDIGLSDLIGTAVCLIEWPDRLGALAPVDALVVSLSAGAGPDVRNARLSTAASRWAPVLARLAVDRAA